MNTPNIQYVAVKGVISNPEGKVLILKQSDDSISGHNQYHPPGGVVELGETLEECLRREIMEETGLEVQVGRLLDAGEWRASRDDDVMQFVGLYYECFADSSNVKLQQDEASEAEWIEYADIEKLPILEPSKSVIKTYLKERT